MHVIRHLSEIPALSRRTALTIGSYDGIHRGHRSIITQLTQAAAERDLAPALITFYPRPKVVLNSHGLPNDYLTTLEEKLLIFEELGLEVVAVLPFSREFAQTSARDFVRQVVDALHPALLWVGRNFKLGHDRAGDIPYLRELGQKFDFEVDVTDLKLSAHEVISSTRIRGALAEGQIREVTNMLGGYPLVLGQVVRGVQRGRTIGFPTANIAPHPEKLLPVDGVYAVWLHVGGEVHPAVANIGVRPTFNHSERTIEVHIFDFNRNIYNQTVRVDLVEFIRPERKFTGKDELVAQIGQDAQTARRILSAERKPVARRGQGGGQTTLPHS